MVFFFTYVFFEVPANVMLKLLKPSTWVSIMMVAWGTVMTLQSLVKTYDNLIVTRLMLGVCEVSCAGDGHLKAPAPPHSQFEV